MSIWTIAAAGLALVCVPQDTGAAGKPQDDLSAQADALEKTADAIDAQTDHPDTRQRAASSSDVAIACRLVPDFHVQAFGRNGAQLPEDQYDALRERMKAMSWRSLPKSGRCKAVRIFQPDGFGDFVTDVARSADGRFVGLRGGWQHAPLMGGGADCLYRIDGTDLKLIGCVHTWVS